MSVWDALSGAVRAICGACGIVVVLALVGVLLLTRRQLRRRLGL